MYLARTKDRKGITHFVIRESIRDEKGNWTFVDLFDLGSDPEAYIHYVGPKGFYIDYGVEESVKEGAQSYSYDDLEALFWPFLDPSIRHTVENFCHGRQRKKTYTRRRLRDRDKRRVELKRRLQGIHPFDRRRILFLKFGQINLEAMLEEPFPFLLQLTEKSRDEIESMLDFMELELRPWEMRGYIYSAFNLPEHFRPRQSRFIPEAQDLSAMDTYFLQELCNLNMDPQYLDKGAEKASSKGVHPYLRKYLFFYFDTFFYSKGGGYIGGRFRKDSGFREPKGMGNASVIFDTHLKVFGLSNKEFKEMDEKALTRLFRRLALKLHPDKGGDHERFIQLKEAYRALISKKAF